MEVVCGNAGHRASDHDRVAGISHGPAPIRTAGTPFPGSGVIARPFLGVWHPWSINDIAPRLSSR